MNAAFEELMQIRDRSDAGVAEISGADPVYSTRFKVAETGAAVLGAIGVAVSDIWEMKTGRRQSAAIDVRHAGAALKSFAHLQAQKDGGAWQTMGNSKAAANAYAITQPWPTKDGRWFLPHFGISHLKERVLGILKCEAIPEAVAAAVAQWEAQELEDTIAAANACGGMLRSRDEWLAHPHGAALATRPVVEIEKIGDSEPEAFASDGAPLAGIRSLDLTRILAGPVAARSLAEQGADVLMVAAPDTPQIKNFVIDLSHGKRSCFLDLNQAADAEQMRQLVAGADVFSQGYRPGALARRGFGPKELAALRPGLIYASINCYGQDGPLSDRAGWEQVAQSMIGICQENGLQNEAKRPELLPVPACDYLTGYLGAYGILLALARRAVAGGSYHVKVSLCQSGMLLQRQGRVDYPAPDMDLDAAEAEALQMYSDTSYGKIRHLAPVIKYTETTPHYARVTPALGGDAAEWLN